MKRLTQIKETQMLTGGLEHFTVATPESIVPTGDKNAPKGSREYNDFYEQARVWEQLVEIFRTSANVVIVSELGAAGFTLAVEFDDAVDPAEVQASIREMGQVEFGMVETQEDDGTGTGTMVGTGEYEQGFVDLSGVVVEEVSYGQI